MSVDDGALAAALAAAEIDAGVVSSSTLSGGCIDRAMRVGLTGGESLVAKRGPANAKGRFEEEAAGLRALAATGTVLVPEPLVVCEHGGEAVFLMRYIEPGPADTEAWKRLGRDLAALHAAEAGERYGFEIDNHLGSTRQVNTWHDDWVEFNRVCRYGFQLRLARDRGLIGGTESREIDAFIDRLENFLPRKPRPALLHGDLWSGNALPAAGGRIAVIDPATYIGDGWADIAMMKLFGGFPATCFEAYASDVEDHQNTDQRIQVYQIYHLMNHLNIFGGGYLGQTLSAVRALMRKG